MTTCYNEDKKVMFIHVHKCAGTAISRAFFGSLNKENPDWSSPRDDKKAKDIMVFNNALIGADFSAPEHFRAIDAQKFLGADTYKSYFSFAVSRNPWDRLASWYYFLRQNQQKEQSKIALQLTMEDFIKYSVDHFYLPQHQWVTDETGKVIVDEIIKLENLDKRWPEMAAKVSDEPITLRTINASSNTTDPKPNPFAHVRTETLEKFREAYAKDFELFGYSTDLPPHRADNPVYINCEKVWAEELNGERDIKSLCKSHKVPEDLYMVYREANSANYYNQLSGSRPKSDTSQRDHIVESLRNSRSENEKLAEKVKKWNVEAKASQKTASENAAALHKSERNLQNRTTENEKLAASVDAMKAEVKALKKAAAEANSNLRKSEQALNKAKAKTSMSKAQEDYIQNLKVKNAELKATVDELRGKSKTDFLALQNKIKVLADKNKALSTAYQKAQDRNASQN